jgi:hypothetical protein
MGRHDCGGALSPDATGKRRSLAQTTAVMKTRENKQKKPPLITKSPTKYS